MKLSSSHHAGAIVGADSESFVVAHRLCTPGVWVQWLQHLILVAQWHVAS